MNTVINRFFSKNGSTSVAEELVRDDRHALLNFLIEKGSNTAQLEQFGKRVSAFQFPQEESIADFNLVQMYLELEWYLLYKDPGYIGTETTIRNQIMIEFPKQSQTDAFTPLYMSGKNKELALIRNFLRYTLRSLQTRNQTESLASRWLGILNFRLANQNKMDLVGQINALREFRESYQELQRELIESFGKVWADSVLLTHQTKFKSFYTHFKAVECIDALSPVEEVLKENVETDNLIHLNGKNSSNKTNSTLQIDRKAILDNILDGFLIFNKNGVILEYNRKVLQMLGVKERDIQNYSLLEFLPNELSQNLRKDLEKTDLFIPNKVIGERCEATLHPSNGHSEEFEISITNNYTVGEDTFSLFLKDITHKKDTLKAIEEGKINAERMAKAKSTFLSNMSHEIRTPLNVILGLSEIIKKRAHMDEALLRKNLDGIDFSAKSLLSIVNDILDFSKIEAGKLSIQSIDFNLPKVVTNLTDGFEIKAREKGLDLSAVIDPSIPDIVIGDQYRLNQILTNLIGNAIKFTYDGKITVSVSNVSESDTSVNLKFMVEDTGIGIAKDKLDRIFESFYQVENPDSSKAHGTGLGLAITTQLIQLQNGTLSASSVIDQGSVFEFTLEFKKSKLTGIADSVKTYVREDKELAGLKVLVAEDNKMNQFYIKQLLNNMNVEVDIAENGKDAVEIFKNANFDYDLILMDMHMPVMNGLEAISLIRNANKYSVKKVPIVACSADVFPEARKNAIKVGIDFYLTKPLNEEAVKEVLFWLRSDVKFETKIGAEASITQSTTGEVKSSSVDINKLQETFDNDEEFIISLLEVFIQETPDDYKSLRHCMEREYYTRASALAHKLKSSFMNLGMTSHGHHLQQIESGLLKKESLEDAKKHLVVFNNLYTKALIEVTILLIELKQK